MYTKDIKPLSPEDVKHFIDNSLGTQLPLIDVCTTTGFNEADQQAATARAVSMLPVELQPFIHEVKGIRENGNPYFIVRIVFSHQNGTS